MPDFSSVETIINQAFPAVPAAQICIRQNNQIIYSRAFGWLDLDGGQPGSRPSTSRTRFDIASVSKLFTTTAFMRMVESGTVTLDTQVCDVLPEFNGLRPIAPYEAPLDEGAFVDVSSGQTALVDAGRITFRNLLVHNSGLPAWRPLYLLANETAARWTVLTSYFSYSTGTQVIYSDLGLILVGMALERLADQPLDQVIQTWVIDPLGLSRTGYIPTGTALDPNEDLAPTEICRWRKRRLWGEVDDENCGRLGGIAGHAGIFSTAEEVALLGQSYLLPGRLLRDGTIAEMTRPHAGQPDNPRGIGFDLWSGDPETFTHPFDPSSFGHTGFTGASLWVDPTCDLVIAFLTNEVYHGRANRVIRTVRASVHQAIAAALAI